MDSSYSLHHSPFASICTETSNDHVLNVSSRASQHLNHSSSSEEKLVKEIAELEGKIVHLERYLLSLYRTAFQRHFFPGNNVQQMNGSYPWAPPETESSSSKRLKDYIDHQPNLAGTNYLSLLHIPKSSSRKLRKNKSGYSQYLGDSGIDEVIDFPDKLSEDIITCISSIYCKLDNPGRAHKGNLVSPSSSFYSPNTLSPRNLSGSWSTLSSDEVTEFCAWEGQRPCSEMVEVTEICLNVETYNYAATMLQKFRSLVKSLAIVDLTKTNREQKLAFWINIHNALVMHSYLAYGTQNYIKSTIILKATYNVGGHSVNAYDIQRDILGIKSHYPASWLRTLLSPGKMLNTESRKHAYAIEYPEPLVHFALCSGAYSDPAIRVYRAKSVYADLKIAKEEFIGTMVQVHHKQRKVNLPKILQYYAKDMSLGIGALLEVVAECLTWTQRDAIGIISEGRPEKCVYWLEQSSSFRYLIHKEVAETSFAD
ncbi:hypothetical protein CASFOL_034761 [Castilleja foliolosa]|uniref:DUF547 domain-containing protein n=1 Tax=Castilleja foliolosa TaxID=1961234 RepID=A0ABD3BRN6_9LAMI